ncbi:DUF5675 family protein [Desertivirga arenae]|uniref:DUF5675 family protein n=1 Tax=Desertivirga arenae TaxID=2810309 RepID=UPI001A9622CC|nr:DUF5675 family protein [Pedobacter sp. SYSU D00823]
MAIKIIRVAKGKNSTLSHLYLNDLFLCYLLEDSIREVKIAGSTCIPEGKYKLGLNQKAGMNSRYKLSYPAMHKGMLEIQGIPNFSLVFLHIGNYTSDTSGCPLTGHYWNQVKGDYQVMQSSFAYQQVYEVLAKEVKAGRNEVLVENRV